MTDDTEETVDNVLDFAEWGERVRNKPPEKPRRVFSARIEDGVDPDQFKNDFTASLPTNACAEILIGADDTVVFIEGEPFSVDELRDMIERVTGEEEPAGAQVATPLHFVPSDHPMTNRFTNNCLNCGTALKWPDLPGESIRWTDELSEWHGDPFNCARLATNLTTP